MWFWVDEYAYTPSKYGSTILISAAENGNLILVNKLLDNNADVNETNGFGGTALYGAIMFDHTDIVLRLLECKADVHACNIIGNNALHTAVYNRESTTNIAALLDHGANAFVKNKSDETPFGLAMERGSHAMMKLLAVHLFTPKTWMCNPSAFRRIPRAMREQLNVLACLWSIRESQSTLVSTLALELLHELFDALSQEYLTNVWLERCLKDDVVIVK